MILCTIIQVYHKSIHMLRANLYLPPLLLVLFFHLLLPPSPSSPPLVYYISAPPPLPSAPHSCSFIPSFFPLLSFFCSASPCLSSSSHLFLLLSLFWCSFLSCLRSSPPNPLLHILSLANVLLVFLFSHVLLSLFAFLSYYPFTFTFSIFFCITSLRFSFLSFCHLVSSIPATPLLAF